MAKLSSGRMSNATRLGKVDDAHNELETDLEAIFGIPDETSISNSVFGGTVNSEGSITGVPVMKSDGQQSDPEDAVGFEFDDGSERKRLVLVNSSLEIHRWDSTSGAWELIANIESPGSGRLQDLSDVDIVSADMVAGRVLQVNNTADKFELVEAASVGGISSFTELDDTPSPHTVVPFQAFDPEKAGWYVAIDGTGDGITFVEPPTGVGNPVAHWVKDNGSYISWPSLSPTADWFIWYRWADAGNVADLVTAATISNLDTNRPNGLITLNPGVYMVGVSFETPSGNKYGTRGWKVGSSGGWAGGPAMQGVIDQAVARLDEGTAGYQGIANPIQDLGSRLLTIGDDGSSTPQQIYIQMQQDSGSAIGNARVSCWIHRVK